MHSAVDRVAARQQIEMVNMIFDAMLTDDPPPSPGEVEGGKIENVENGNPSSDQNIEILQKGEESTYHNDAEGDLSTPAAHIFLYFIQVIYNLPNCKIIQFRICPLHNCRRKKTEL